MAANERAQRNHEELFPDHISTLAVTDPELIEVFDNFAFDEVLRDSQLDARTRLMVQLAALIASQALREYRVMVEAALTVGVTPVEEFALRLAGHFAGTGPVERAQVRVEEYGWRRIDAQGTPDPHSFERQAGTRVTSVLAHADGGTEIVTGVTGLVLLKSSGSEFRGFLQDPYTTLEPTEDRILATAVSAHWRNADRDTDWDLSFAGARAALVEAFAVTHSRSLQQTLYAMAEAVLAARPEVSEVRLALEIGRASCRERVLDHV